MYYLNAINILHNRKMWGMIEIGCVVNRCTVEGI